ncbi:MAG: FAD-dependent oxidoreductase, partial [Methanobacteriota archaeon]
MSCPSCERKSHLIIVGGGSAAFAAAIRATELGAKATIINAGLPIGGTCVNVGCVPSKTLIRAAEIHYKSNHNPFKGIWSQSEVVDFREIIRQKSELVNTLREDKYIKVAMAHPDITIVEGWARV